MDIFQLIEERRSMRKFSDRPVEAEKLTRILETADRAPSAGNLQGYEIYVVRSLALKQLLVVASWGQDFIAEAPVVLVFCANGPRSASKYKQRGSRLYAIQDATIACAYSQLAAKALDLDTVWVGAFSEGKVAKILHLPKDHRPIILLPIGYAGKDTKPRPRRGVKDLVHELDF